MRYILTFIALMTIAGCSNPMGPFSGGRLSAPESATPFTNWSHIANVDTVFVETRPDDPYSVQTWCISVDEQLFIPTSLILGDSDATARTWVQNVESNGQVRVQIDDTVYPMQAMRITDKELHARVLSAFQAKYAGELPEVDEHASRAWIYGLKARGN